MAIIVFHDHLKEAFIASFMYILYVFHVYFMLINTLNRLRAPLCTRLPNLSMISVHPSILSVNTVQIMPQKVTHQITTFLAFCLLAQGMGKKNVKTEKRQSLRWFLFKAMQLPEINFHVCLHTREDVSMIRKTPAHTGLKASFSVNILCVSDNVLSC